MKIFDCTTYYNEDLMLEVRFNMLNQYVDKFIVVEAKYSHSGKKKKLNFNIKNFTAFKKKIIYIIVNNEPENIIYENKDYFNEKESEKRLNSIKRINHQRNQIIKNLDEADDNDYILYSDNDEIPNLENFNFSLNKSKIIIFKQKLFYYKFNLYFDRISWFGTKGCKKKDLISLSWLRDIKAKKYQIYRFDTFFSKVKYIDVKIVENGGWHFSQVKTPKDIEIKLLNGEQHAEFKQANKNLDYISGLVKRKVIDYDHMANSSGYKYSKEFKLKTLPLEEMPEFLRKNSTKYSEWIDFEK